MSSINFHNYYEDTFTSPYYVGAGRIAATTSIQTPNQLLELQQRLNLGVKNVEISGPLDPEVFDQIPKQHFEEMRKLAKLTGADVSLHAPMFDLAGFGEQGWSEDQRRSTEEHFKNIVERANLLNPNGNIPVTIHASGNIPSIIPEKGLGTYSEEQSKKIGMPELKGKEIPRILYAVNQEEGKLLPLKYEEKEYLGYKKTWTPHERLENQNETLWDNDKLQVLSYQKNLDELERRRNELIQQNLKLFYGAQHGLLRTDEEKRQLERAKSEMEVWENHILQMHQHINSHLNELNHKLNTYGKDLDEEDKKRLRDLREAWARRSKIEENYRDKIITARSHGNFELTEDLIRRRNKEIQEKVGDKASTSNTINILSEIRTPKVLVPVDEFVAEKASQTIVNTALNAFKKFGDKAPTVAIENWRPQYALSRGESFQDFVTKTKNDFVTALVKKENLNEHEAREVANKLIGATWDVAHINMLRRFGYTEEDIIREAQKVKGSDIKKIHLADNFGYTDSHLPTGMGNVPTLKQLEELQKTGLKKEIPQIGEFGAFDVNFKESSIPYALQALGSPLYSYEMLPRWSNIWELYGNYFTGHGMILPDVHFRDLYGAGFSTLPKELGGQIPGDRSRFAGTPNQ